MIWNILAVSIKSSHQHVPFQGDEMWKRPRRDSEMKELGYAFYRHIPPQGKPGYNREDIAFRNGAWFLESLCARGIYEADFGLCSWENKIQGMSELPKRLKFDGKDPEYNTRLVKKAAKFLGATLVGICKVDPRWTHTKGFDLLRHQEFNVEIPNNFQCMINIAMAHLVPPLSLTPET